MCAVKCSSQLGFLGAMYECSVIEILGLGEGEPASIEFSRLFLSRKSVIGMCSVVM